MHDTGRTGIEMIQDALEYPIERWTANAKKVLRDCDIFFGLDPDDEAQRRQEELDEWIALDIIEGILRPAALPALDFQYARGRLIRKGVLVKKSKRAKWRINSDKDPRQKLHK